MNGDSVYEARLIARFKAGDARALETLFDRYIDRALGVAIRLTETREDAEEVVQEAFLRAFRTAREMRGDSVGGFGAYLFAIVRNLAADRRRQLRLPTLSLSAPEAESLSGRANVSEEAERRAERADVLAALDSLSEEYRTILTLCDLEDIPHAEAAIALGRSIPATKSLLYRARRALRDALTQLWNDH